jgi:hypothetical protein
MLLISQIGLEFLHARAFTQIDTNLSFFIARVKHHHHVRAILVDVSGAEEVVVVADADTVGVGPDVAGEMRERPCAFGDFVLAVLDLDELFVFVGVCVAVLDDEPPEKAWSVYVIEQSTQSNTYG